MKMLSYINKLFFLFIFMLIFIPAQVNAQVFKVSNIETLNIKATSVEIRIEVINYNSNNTRSDIRLECNSGASISNKISINGNGFVVATVSGLIPDSRNICRPSAVKSNGEKIYGHGTFFRTLESNISSSQNNGAGSNINTADARKEAIVFTKTATDVSGNSAILNARVDGGGAAFWWFEYGETISLGKKTTEIGIQYEESVNNYIEFLKPETLYYFRVVARNKYGVKYGNTFAFLTQKADIFNTAEGIPSNINVSGNEIVSTKTSVEVRNNTTIIDGIVPAGDSVTAWFEYGKTNRLGSKTEDKVFDGKQEYIFSDTLYNLDDNTEYYVQPVYEINNQVVRGDMISFSTSQNDKHGSVARVDKKQNLSGLFGMRTSVSNEQPATVSGGFLGIFNKEVDSKDLSETRKEVEENIQSGFSQSNEYMWGEYLQNRFFSMTDNAPAFGFATSQFKPQGEQRASASKSFSFLPNTLLDWIFLIVLLFITISFTRSKYLLYKKRKKETEEQRQIQENEGGADLT